MNDDKDTFGDMSEFDDPQPDVEYEANYELEDRMYDVTIKGKLALQEA